MSDAFAKGLLPDGTPNWALWVEDEKWVESLLRGLIVQTPQLHLRLAYLNAIETMRGGKVVFHWNLNLDRLVTEVFDATVLQNEQTFFLTPLKESPILCPIEIEQLEGVHPDLITIVVALEVTGKAATGLVLPTGTRLIIIFELDLPSELVLKWKPSEHEPKIPYSTVVKTPFKPFCAGCSKDIIGPRPPLKCKSCKIVQFCSANCQELARMKNHADLCPVLPDACRTNFDRCRMKPL